MATAFRPLTRAQLASFLPDNESIRAFEQLFKALEGIAGLDVLTIAERLLELSAEGAAVEARVDVRLGGAQSFDYVDFSRGARKSAVPGRVGWNAGDDTLDIHHTGGVTQQVGLETYALVENNTGVLMPNGTLVGYGGVGVGDRLDAVPYVADGTMPSFYVLGVLTQDVPDTGQKGRCTVFGHVRELDTTGGPVGETWADGDVLYAHPTVPGALTNVKPTAPSLVIPIAEVLIVSATVGSIFVRPVIEQQSYYGLFIKTADQSPAVINTAYPILLDVAAQVANGFSVDPLNLSRVVAGHSGLYNIDASFQLVSGSASVKNVWLWFRKNGVDVPGSSMKVALESASAVIFPSRGTFMSLDAGDYFELMWASDSTNVTLDALAATGFAPAAPACILSVTQVQQ